DRKPRPAPIDSADGRAGLREEHVPVEHRRPAHVVHHPGLQAWIRRPQEGSGLPRGDESGNGKGGCAHARSRRGRRLRRAAQAERSWQRRRVLSRAVRQAGRDGLPGREAATAGPEHDYDGILAKLLGIDLSLMEKALNKQLGRKAKAVTLNQGALKAGWDYAETNFTKQDPFFLEPMNATAGKILIEGNAAAAIGCMMAGVTVVAGHP